MRTSNVQERESCEGRPHTMVFTKLQWNKHSPKRISVRYICSVSNYETYEWHKNSGTFTLVITLQNIRLKKIYVWDKKMLLTFLHKFCKKKKCNKTNILFVTITSVQIYISKPSNSVVWILTNTGTC